MDFSIEARVPFLRKQTAQMANSILKRNHTSMGRKSVLRQAFHSDLPDFIYGKDKQRFKAPISSWISAEFKSRIMRTLSNSEAISILGLTCREVNQSLNRGSYRLIWGLYTLIRWVELEYKIETQEKLVMEAGGL
jgi:asparagine synthetase B (glutamine-hydrolysing)